jgi:N-acetylmuramoyl-L-alanine amidase
MNVISRPSPNCAERGADGLIDMLVLHYTGMRSAGAALARMCDPAAKVSAHYCIGEDGNVFRLVDEKQCAWHAGVSYWRGHEDINARSIGIELVNPGHEFGYRAFPEAQMDALIDLCGDILSRQAIAPRNVVGHSDIAPSRKTDPGELFDWKRLAGEGIGLWPDPAPGDPADPEKLPAMLADYGYNTGEEGALAAFQRHFRPSRIDAKADEETAGLLAGLLAIAD